MKKIIHNLHSPAYSLVIKTALQNWWLIAINLLTNVLSAFLEGSTLGVIYLAVAYLTSVGESGKDTKTYSGILQTLSAVLPLPAEQMFLGLIGMALLLQIFLSLSNYANKVSTAYLSAKAQPYVTGKVFEQIMTFSYSCVSQYKVGDLVLFANDAALAVERQIDELNKIIVGLSFSLIYLVLIVRLSPTLAAAAALLTLLVVCVQYKIIPRLRRVVKRATATQVESAKYITESIQALRLLHTFGTQKVTLTEADKFLNKIQEELQKRAFIFYLPEPILDTLPILALAILATSAVVLKSEGATILPMLLTFLLALQRLSARLKMTANAIIRFVDNSARMLRLETILNPYDKSFEHSGTKAFIGLNKDIEFHSVSLSYTSNSVLALQDLTFRIPLNRVTALVGESGAGKSSIIDLLMGLYQPTDGKILVNDLNLADYSLEEWRQYVGVVSQDTFIFNDSIIENLRYGRPDANRDDVIEATKAAQAHEFILALPDGYETMLGERGYRLSGGQKQRLALARALIRKPDILILDEATSALDSESEKFIQQALDKFQKNRTVIVVAHRLSTIANADQILVLEQGRIIEQGTHASLLQQGGRYARYWQLQSSKVAA